MAGTLSAIMAAGATSSAQLSGGSALTADVIAKLATPISNLSSSGILDAGFFARFAGSAVLSGDGTITFAKKQVYHLSGARIQNPVGNGTLVATAAFPVKSPVLTTFTTPGAYTYPIPYWCKFVDVIAVGAGGGGGGCDGVFQGEGGGAGDWKTYTFGRPGSGAGYIIPWSTTEITGVVGAGGTAGAIYTDGGIGGGTYFYTAGVFNDYAAGGDRGASSSGAQSGVNGDSPGNQTYNGQTYVGGAVSIGNPAVGNAPGGGAAARKAVAGAGAAGARGQMWFYAYQ